MIAVYVQKKTEWIRAFGIRLVPTLLAIGVRNIFFPQLHVAYDILIWIASGLIYRSIRSFNSLKDLKNPITKSDYEEKIEILIAEGKCTREEVNKWSGRSADEFLGKDFAKKFANDELLRKVPRTLRVLLSISGAIIPAFYIIIMIWYIFSSGGPSSRSAVFFPYYFTYGFFSCLLVSILARLNKDNFQPWMENAIFFTSPKILYIILALAVGSISSIWYFWLW